MKLELCSCGGTIVETLTPQLVHHAERRCVKCEAWYGWVKAPCNEDKRVVSKFSVRAICQYHKIKTPQCFFCLRTKNQLYDKETLTRDHIVENNEGGLDIIENLQVLCSACHKLKNWARLYMNWHNKKDGNTNTTPTG